MIKEKLLFVVHGGTIGDRRAGIIMQDHCLPIACSHRSYPGHGGAAAEAGICALWESMCEVEAFFAALGIGPGIEAGPGVGGQYNPPNGLYVYTIEYDAGADGGPDYEDLADDEWPGCAAERCAARPPGSWSR